MFVHTRCGLFIGSSHDKLPQFFHHKASYKTFAMKASQPSIATLVPQHGVVADITHSEDKLYLMTRKCNRNRWPGTHPTRLQSTSPTGKLSRRWVCYGPKEHLGTRSTLRWIFCSAALTFSGPRQMQNSKIQNNFHHRVQAYFFPISEVLKVLRPSCFSVTDSL